MGRYYFDSTKDGRIHFHLDRINLACFPNQGLSNINKEQLCDRALGSLAPETWTSCYDHRADIFLWLAVWLILSNAPLEREETASLESRYIGG